MTYLLFNKPQRLAQVNRQRRHKSTPSGVCVIHTAEGSGANNVANYILTRTSYGSYHRIIDASTTVKLAPWSAETFHCRYTNPHSVGISAATFAANWNSLYKQPGDPGHRIIDRMAIEAADFIKHMKSTHKITVPVKRITRSDALNKKPGFLAHGDTDPGRRTDPGAQFDWTYFFNRINHHLGKSGSTPTKPVTAQPQPLLSKFYYPSAYYVIDGIDGPATITGLQRFLSDRGYYKRVIDGIAGSYTWTALQEFLSDLGYFGPKPSGKQDMTTARALQQWLTSNGSYKQPVAAKPKWDKATWSAFQTYLRYAHKGTKVYKRKPTTDFKPTTPPKPAPTLPTPKGPLMALTDKEQQSLLDDNRKMKTAIERNERRLEEVLALLDTLDPKPAPKATKATKTAKEDPKNG